MKKRAKIITTIASLCLAVALMAFGVYAAQAATLNVTSSVSFVAKDVKVHWTIGVTGARGEGLDPSAAGNRYDLNTTGKEGAETESLTATLGNFEFDLDHRTITYTFTCTNESEKQSIDIAVGGIGEAAIAYFTDEAVSGDAVLNVTYKQGDLDNVTANQTDAWNNVTVAPNGVYVYEVVLELVDITSDISATTQRLGVSFTAIKHVAQP